MNLPYPELQTVYAKYAEESVQSRMDLIDFVQDEFNVVFNDLLLRYAIDENDLEFIDYIVRNGARFYSIEDCYQRIQKTNNTDLINLFVSEYINTKNSQNSYVALLSKANLNKKRMLAMHELIDQVNYVDANSQDKLNENIQLCTRIALLADEYAKEGREIHKLVDELCITNLPKAYIKIIKED